MFYFSFISFVFVSLTVDIRCDKFIHPMKDEEYNILLKLCKGEFSVLVAKRSRAEKAAVIKFWRSREKFSNDGNTLLYDGKKVIHFICFKLSSKPFISVVRTRANSLIPGYQHPESL